MAAVSATMTSKGQVTVPRRIRQLLGLKAGETLVFRPVGKHVVQLTPGPGRSRLEGCLRGRILRGLPPPTVEEMDAAIARNHQKLP